jgi:hypothetical protein
MKCTSIYTMSLGDPKVYLSPRTDSFLITTLHCPCKRWSTSLGIRCKKGSRWVGERASLGTLSTTKTYGGISMPISHSGFKRRHAFSRRYANPVQSDGAGQTPWATHSWQAAVRIAERESGHQPLAAALGDAVLSISSSVFRMDWRGWPPRVGVEAEEGDIVELGDGCEAFDRTSWREKVVS